MRAAREGWFEGQLDLDPDALVFIDETAATTAMARRYGRAPRGERCRMAVPQSHWKTTTITAGLRASGVTAPWLLDGAMNGQAFRSYGESVLSPALRPGDTVVLDNLPAHSLRAAERLPVLSYPLSPTAARGVMSGPRSSKTSKGGLSLA